MCHCIGEKKETCNLNSHSDKTWNPDYILYSGLGMFPYTISSIFTKSSLKVTILWTMQQKPWEVRQITNVGANSWEVAEPVSERLSFHRQPGIASLTVSRGWAGIP